MNRINTFLADADIDFIDDGGESVDVQVRRLQRRFVIPDKDPQIQRFDLSGRMFGGFWENLARHRRANIRINGERVAVADFSSMFVRFAYTSKGLAPPMGDLYAIPGLEGHRRAVKAGVNGTLFDKHVRTRWPQVDDLDERLPDGRSMAGFRRAVLRHLTKSRTASPPGWGWHSCTLRARSP
jgi:hypothetical protein